MNSAKSNDYKVSTNWGRTQAQRFPAPLDGAYARIDQHSTADYLAIAGDYSRLLAFHELNGKVDGDWSSFLAFDISFLLAQICTINQTQENYDVLKLERESLRGAQVADQILKNIYAMAQRINGWYLRSQAIDRMQPMADVHDLTLNLMSTIRKDLGKYVKFVSAKTGWGAYWKKLQQEVRGHDQPQAVGNGSRDDQYEYGLDAIWFEGDEDKDLPQHLDLITILHAFNNADSSLMSMAQEHLQDSLANKSDHPPHTTLYLAFVRLLRYLQTDLNNFTDRHLDFYYRDVLQLCEQDSRPDSAHMVFELSTAFDQHLLAAGTLLKAGKDGNGDDVLYATDEDITLSRAKIVSLRTIFVEPVEDEEGYSSFTTGDKLKRVRQVFSAPVANSQDGIGAPLKKPELGWASFGTFVPENFSVAEQLYANLGFLISSPVLLLQEGERKVTLTFRFDDSNSDKILRAVTHWAELTYEPGRRPSLVEIFADGCRLFISGAKSWVPIQHFKFKPPVSADGLTLIDLEFTLKAGDPPTAANSLLEEGIASPWPMFKLVLNPHARVYQYSSFVNMILNEIAIRVEVSGLRQIELQGALGPIASDKPFAPFGVMPVRGSALQISAPELSNKQLQSSNITISWLDLPRQPGDFEAYYQGYDLGLSRESFKSSLAVYADGQWQALDGRNHDRYPLFTLDAAGAALAPDTQFALDLSTLQPAPLRNDSMQQSQTLSTPAKIQRAALRMELVEPDCAFGHAQYADVFAKTAIENIARVAKKEELKKLNPPYTPLAKSITLDYVASDRVQLSGSGDVLRSAEPPRFYQIYPFGFSAQQADMRTMVPIDDSDGHLYIGLTDLEPGQSLTMLFQFRENTASQRVLPQGTQDITRRESRRAIKWRFLANNRWEEFGSNKVISDTEDFTRSGIIKFQIPREITNDNTVMPSGIFWIEARIAQHPSECCALIDILTQSVRATRVRNGYDGSVPISQPTGSIKDFVTKVAAVKSVAQPFPSFGGRAKESVPQYRTRVSERLKHKQRAIMPSDYEQLVLNAFPAVGQVKCIVANNSREFDCIPKVGAGEIVMAVVPPVGPDSPAAVPPIPLYLLSEMARYLRLRSSPFIRAIHVRNAEYERLKVFCEVAFKGDGESAVYLQRLNDAIFDYLTPWRIDGGQPMALGSGLVHGYQIAAFIKSQSYVDAVGPVTVLHTYKHGTDEVLRRGEGNVLRWISEAQAVRPSAPWSVLIPATQHGITPMEKSMGGFGIGQMDVGGNFIVGETATPDKSRCEGLGSLILGTDLIITPAGPLDASATDDGQPKLERYFAVFRDIGGGARQGGTDRR